MGNVRNCLSTEAQTESSSSSVGIEKHHSLRSEKHVHYSESNQHNSNPHANKDFDLHLQNLCAEETLFQRKNSHDSSCSNMSDVSKHSSLRPFKPSISGDPDVKSRPRLSCSRQKKEIKNKTEGKLYVIYCTHVQAYYFHFHQFFLC